MSKVIIGPNAIIGLIDVIVVALHVFYVAKSQWYVNQPDDGRGESGDTSL